MRDVRIEINTLTADLFLQLFASVGWEPPGSEQVRRALQNSVATFTAYDGSTAVGMVRLLGDGGMSFYLKDFAVIPACQHQGVGHRLLTQAQDYVLRQLEPGWAVSLELISTREPAAFYEKNGFEPRPCAWDGPGMMKMLRK